jgi:DWNN domain
MSVIRYRFKSAKDFDTLTFDGPSLHVWEVKDEIIVAKKLQKSLDFDLVLTNAQTNEGTDSIRKDTNKFILI